MTEKTQKNAEHALAIGEVVLASVGLVFKVAGIFRKRTA
jgi:hypothetical protein